MSPSRKHTLTLSLLLAGAFLGMEALSAQVPGLGPQAQGGWAPPSFGLRFGWDNQQQSEMLGAQVRLPVVPGGEIELIPSMDISFLRGLKEYQYNIDGVYVWDGRAGGLYGGAGLAMRNTDYGDGEGRRTALGYSALIGLRIVGLGLVVPQLEYRWVSVKAAPINYQQLTLGVNLALWRPVPPR